MKKNVDFVQENKEAYDRIARPFAGTREYVWDDLVPLKKYVKDGDRVLDVGCGVGRLYQLFRGLSIRYTGIDQSKEQLLIGKELYPDAAFVLGEMTALPFADHAFDIVFCIATLHHLSTRENRLQALSEMKRVVMPGGYGILTNWNLESEYAKRKIKEGKWWRGAAPDHIIVPWRVGSGESLAERHYWNMRPETIADTARAAGFFVVEQYFSTKGKKTDEQRGDNIVSILRA